MAASFKVPDIYSNSEPATKASQFILDGVEWIPEIPLPSCHSQWSLPQSACLRLNPESSPLWMPTRPCMEHHCNIVSDDYMHAVLTCFAVLRQALSLSSRVDGNHSDSVDSIRLQVLQHSVVGAA